MRAIFAFTLLTAFFLAACNKQDHCPQPSKEASCNLAQSTLDYGPDSGVDPFSQYRKEYDPATGRVTKVVAGLYSIDLLDSIALQLQYSGRMVYFIADEKPSDTVLVAIFDANNRLISMVNKKYEENVEAPTFERATEFTYSNNRLSQITRHSLSSQWDLYTSYDANGNIMRIYQAEDDANAGTFYTYDLTVRASAQFYSDGFGTDDLNNETYLAQFMGWLPDLEPVNKRTSFRIVFNDDDTTDGVPGEIWYHTILSDHVYDSNDRLLSYRYADEQKTYTNTWNCKDKKSPN